MLRPATAREPALFFGAAVVGAGVVGAAVVVVVVVVVVFRRGDIGFSVYTSGFVRVILAQGAC